MSEDMSVSELTNTHHFQFTESTVQ